MKDHKDHGDGIPREVDERLADWVDGRMGSRERERFEAELRVNPQLRRDLDDYERTVGVLRAALRAPSPGSPRAPIADRVLAEVQKQATSPAVRAATPFRLQRLWWTIASAAALLVVAVYVNGLGVGPARTDVAVVEPAAVEPGTGFDGTYKPTQANAEMPEEERRGGGAGAATPAVDPKAILEDLAKKSGAAEGEAKKLLAEDLKADAGTAPAPVPEVGARLEESNPDQRQPSASKQADGKALVPAPGAAVGAAAGPSSPGPGGPTAGGRLDATRGEPGVGSGEGHGSPGDREEAPRSLGARPAQAAGAERAPATEQSPPVPTPKGEPRGAKPSGGREGRRGRGAEKTAPVTVAMVLVDGIQPTAPTWSDKERSPRVADGSPTADRDAKAKAAADRGQSTGGLPTGVPTDKAAPNLAERSKDTAQAHGLELLDQDTLRTRATALFAAAEDVDAGAGATTFATARGRIDLQPVLDVAFELDDVPAEAKAASAPAIVDRTWLVAGPREDVQTVLTALAEWSRQHRLVLRSGETKASPSLLGEALAASRPVEAEKSLPAASDRPVVEAAARMQVVVRIRLRARQ
ncbi:MAG: hypothetical protein JNK15_03870 [Planctomycetes bacterium]|nr:hypothetical protein [Planctomycetota bacterium]